MDDDCCGNCKYFTNEYLDDVGINDDIGQCTRFPPLITGDPFNDKSSWVTAERTKFPILSYVMICGEFVEK